VMNTAVSVALCAALLVLLTTWFQAREQRLPATGTAVGKDAGVSRFVPGICMLAGDNGDDGGVVKESGAAAGSGPNAPRRVTKKVLLDLSKKETLVVMPSEADRRKTHIAALEVAHLPAAYHLVPKNGIVRLGQPVCVVLAEPPAVRIQLSLVQRSTDLVLKIEPQVILEQIGPVDLTQERIERAARTFNRQAREFTRRLTASQREHQQIDAWLASPGNKPLELVKEARSRLRILERQIALAQREAPAANRRHLALAQIATLAAKLHETVEFQFEVRY